MDKAKTYDLHKALVFSVAISVGLVILSFLLSLSLGSFRAMLQPDQGADWYFWKLPSPALWASILLWVLYAVHQALVWWLITRLKKQPALPQGRLGSINVWLLVVNAGFAVLHLLQTLFFYDGLAQFVPVMSSQGSVIVMLVMVLVMLNHRRGLFFGKKVALPKRGVAAIAQLHGYFIAWAVVYTFWFHPMEGTLGHLLGFFYLFMLMTQISLAKTSWHTNLRWITFLEGFVALHGAVVAIVAGNGMWPMFFFGFTLMFIVTQVYGVVRSKAVIVGISAAYVVLVLLTYGGVFRYAFSGTPVGIASIHQITWIPVILYGLVFILAWLAQGVTALRNLERKP